MDLKNLYTSSKTYIVLLVTAIAVLLFTATMAYRQIKRMQKSADMVAHTLQVNNAISELSAHYTQAESEEFRQNLLEDKDYRTYEKYVSEGRVVMDSLKSLTSDNSSQQQRLGSIDELLSILNGQLSDLNLNAVPEAEQNSSQHQKAKINSTLYRIRILKNEMLAEEQRLMKERQADYDSQKFLAPLTSLLLGFFALFVFGVSFLRIYNNKQRLRQSEAFLQNVLATTNNIVNYYEPIFDRNRKIIDFKIVFANDCNRDYLGLEPKEIIGKRISEVFPFLMLNGELEELVRCHEESTKVQFDRQVAVHGEKMWFESIITPMAQGILVTVRNSTEEEKAKQEQLALNQRLLVQNEKLSEVRSFLSNILANTDNIITYFTPVYNDKNDIVDLTIAFTNDNITQVLDKDLVEIEHKLLSEIVPINFENGVFEILASCLQDKKKERFEKQYEFNGKNFGSSRLRCTWKMVF